MAAHIASFVILCRPPNRDATAAAIAALPGLHIHHCSPEGRIVAIAEGDDARIGELITGLQSAPGVIAANLVYHGIDEEEDDAG